jgi:hypothetical protein
MSEISSEMNKVADEWDVTPLYALANRVDDETVTLPKDGYGSPIHVGQVVYDKGGDAWEVLGISFGSYKMGEHPIYARDSQGHEKCLNPKELATSKSYIKWIVDYIQELKANILEFPEDARVKAKVAAIKLNDLASRVQRIVIR